MNVADLDDAPVLVAGAGVSGRAAAAALVELGARVTVTDANGALLGHVRKRIRLGKAVFTVTGPSGEPIGKLLAENWRSKDFRLEATSGVEVARVTKKWRGLLTEVFTDADSYAVTFPMSTDDGVRQLALAAAIAVDLTMKQKDYGSPLDLIDF